MEQSDQSLLAAMAKDGDGAAFTELCDRYHKSSYNFAFRILRSSELAEDAVQEALLSLWQSRKSLSSGTQARGWIMSVVAHKSIDLKRSRAQSAKRVERMAKMQSKEGGAIDEIVAGEELIEKLRDQIDQLPELECTLLLYCYGSSLSHQKIGDMVGLSQQAVSQKINAALQRLRTKLAGAGAVASFVPVLDAESLFKAISTGHECPPGMRDRIVSRAMNPGSQLAKASTRTKSLAIQKSGMALLPIAGVFAAAVVAGAALWQPWKSSMPLVVAPIIAPANKPLFEKWDFTNGYAGNFAVWGDWKWRPGTGTQTGAMAAAGIVVAKVPITLPKRPCVVILSVQETLDEARIDALWCEGESFPPYQFWKFKTPYTNPNGFEIRVYFKDACALQFIDEKLLSARKFDDSCPFDQICLSLKNVVIQKVVVRDFTAEEQASALRNPGQQIEKMAALPDVVTGTERGVPWAEPLSK